MTTIQVGFVKHDRGYRAMVVNCKVDETKYMSHGLRSFLPSVGEMIQNRNFQDIKVGEKFYALVKITPKGRRMVKEVWFDLAGKLGEPETHDEPEIMGGTLVEIFGDTEVFSDEKLHELSEMFKTTEDSKGEKTEMSDTMSDVIETASLPQKKAAKKSKSMRVNGYYVSPEARLIFTGAKAMSDAKPERSVKLMMMGASGYGKTTLPKLFAEMCGKKFMRMNCATIRDPEEWFGYREAVDGNTVFIKSNFSKMIEEGNAVIVLDEFNRLEPWLHNTLFPLLDDDGCTVVHDQEFKIGPGVIVVGTINTGYKYTGTFELDEALLNRFEFIMEVGSIPHDEEVKVLVERTGVEDETASQTVKMANKLRQTDIICSTRTTLLVASMVKSGLELREAYEVALVRRIPDDGSSQVRKQVVDMINIDLGPFKTRRVDNDVFSQGEVEVKSDSQKVERVEVSSPSRYGETTMHKVHPAIVLSIADGKKVNTIGLMSSLRKLDTVECGQMSITQVTEIAKAIVDGERVAIPLNVRPERLEDFISELREFGLGGVFTKTAKSKVSNK